jgi:hypothetical protein
MKNKYSKLPLPKDSAWERKSWRRFVHWRIRYVIDGVRNIIRWVPVLFHDRDWDDYFITKMLQKKIEHQRKYLVEHNRHLTVDKDNFWMTVILNLIEAEHEDYYGCEYMDYYETEGFLSDNLIVDNLDEYINKYPGAKRAVLKKYPNHDFSEKKRLAFYMSGHRQKKCRDLLFEILKRKSNQWWD